ncbi:pimeloyl-ACP methyl ester carboxylesterase [Nonomuraea polychroma]|uniref:Pimeloyl-ACP methyl ester carboxylesterase n=1 Tax=Nonomuraea polychroma TaxID=46176 RepID=A0A438M6N2_9ACTN|nr:alpha/beta fold hydrolase [Nonomuraea polychroma]RVX41364.1 pimeloyl-ACP methyl ester carboxylesterase [Nonomuraea polychroma]
MGALLSSLRSAAEGPRKVLRAATLPAARISSPIAAGAPSASFPSPHAANLREAAAARFVEGQLAGLAPVTMACERRGTGEPVVLLHGIGHHRRAWDAVVPHLIDARETIAVDLPGFGQSPDLPPSVPRDLPTTVSALRALFAALGLDRPHVVGHSLGGLIALRLAQAGLARSVTALAPAGFWTAAERRYAFGMLTAAWYGTRLLPEGALERLSRTAAGQAVLTGTLYGQTGRCTPETVVAGLRALREARGFTATLRAGRAPDLFSGEIPGIPVTIAWGSCDRILPGRQAARVLTMIPRARLVWLPGCGHVPMNDAPELIADLILAASRSGLVGAGEPAAPVPVPPPLGTGEVPVDLCRGSAARGDPTGRPPATDGAAERRVRGCPDGRRQAGR